MRNLIAAENEGQEKKMINVISFAHKECAKGQLISKCLYCVFNSSEK